MLRTQGVPLDIVLLKSFYKTLGRKTAKQHQPVLQVCCARLLGVTRQHQRGGAVV